MVKFIALSMLFFLSCAISINACQVCDLAEAKQKTDQTENSEVCDWCGSISYDKNRLLNIHVENGTITLHSECVDMYLGPNSFELCAECKNTLEQAKNHTPTPTLVQEDQKNNSQTPLRISQETSPIEEKTREYGGCMARAFACFPCLYCLLTGSCSCQGCWETYKGACIAGCCCYDEES